MMCYPPAGYIMFSLKKLKYQWTGFYMITAPVMKEFSKVAGVQ